MDAVPIDLESLFERARMPKEDIPGFYLEGWTPVDIPGIAVSYDLSLTRLELSQDSALLCAEYEVTLPISVCTMLAQPEVYFDSRRQANDTMSAWRIEKLISPGDAVVWAQMSLGPLMQHTTALLGTPQIGALSMTGFRIRESVRRDWPQPGSVTIVVAPLHPDTSELLEEIGFIKAITCVMESAGEDLSRTRCWEIKKLTRVPSWVLPMAAVPHFKNQLDDVLFYVGSEAFKQAIQGPGSYIIVGMRRCVKGPPLLPRQGQEISDATEWEEAESGGVRLGLPEYLQIFLQRIGVKDVNIYDRLHGRQVVRYQAVVQRQAWEAAWLLLENPFRAQRAAYRRLHGGTNAPALTFDMEPKFLALNECNASTSVGDEGYGGESVSVPTARTFVHFSESSTRSRLGSEPAYIDIDYYKYNQSRG